MTLRPPSRLVNPRLGTYFGIFTSGLAGLVVMSLLLEQLGWSAPLLRGLLLGLPLVLYVIIGAMGVTREPGDYFAAGRRVPAVYGGLNLAVTALGATGLLALTGELFVIGYDALAIVVGAVSGFVVLAVLLAPFLRKFGAFTVPSYLGRRFDSRALRIASGLVLIAPTLLMLIAELRMGARAVTELTGFGTGTGVALLLFVLLAGLGAGGMRSLTWSGVAQGITAMLALLVPLAIVGVMQTNLPLPQLSHGPAAKLVWRLEQTLGFPNIQAAAWAAELPGEGFHAMAKKLVSPFANVGEAAYLGLLLTVMAGIAASPWLLPRVAAAPGVYEARKSLGWATFFFGVVMTSLAAVAVFARQLVMELAAAQTTSIPPWLSRLVAHGFADIDRSAATLKAQSVLFDRDAVLLTLVPAFSLPDVLLYVLLVGVVAAALAAAGASLLAFGNILAEDIVGGLVSDPGPGERRIWIARAGLAIAAACAGLAALAPLDPLKLVLWALALTGSAAFPVLVLSIWWKRINAYGALAGVVTGFTVALLAVLAGETHALNFDSPLAGVFGIPAAILATISTSLATPAPGRHLLELVRDIRIPGGEILYDRELRIARLKKRQGIKTS